MTHLIEKHKTKNVEISRSQNVPNNWIQFRAAHSVSHKKVSEVNATT